MVISMKRNKILQARAPKMLISMVSIASPALCVLTDDAIITSGVKERLNRLHGASLAGVSVRTRNRVVTLQGAVGNTETIKCLEELARGVPGVAGVDNRLVLETAANCDATTAS